VHGDRERRVVHVDSSSIDHVDHYPDDYHDNRRHHDVCG
jgi:hypothetical protein